ncbi:MAG: hypothetical protein V6Z82_06960 [Flavobacteriales bacterium]
MNLIKKLTVKTVVGNLKAMVKAGDVTEGAIMRVMGIATGQQSGTSDFGDWIAFKGKFRAINIITGEEFHSAKCLLPEVASDLVVAAMAENESVEFAFDIKIQLDETAATGYVYLAQPLVEAQQDDPLERLASSVTMALPKPGKVEKPAKDK